MFNGYLTQDEIGQLVDAAVNAGLVDPGNRAFLLDGLPPGFRATLAIQASPAMQFRSDLGRLNQVEMLSDSSVPLALYLDNATRLLRQQSLPEATLFASMQSAVKNRATGAPAMPAPADLPEIKANEQVIAEDDSLEIAFLGRGVEVSKAVARISVPRFTGAVQLMQPNGAPWIMFGTAWLLAPDLAITNRHVINARRQGEPDATAAELELQANGAVLEFGLDTSDAVPTTATVTGLLAVSEGLDYALLEIAGGPGGPVPKIRKELVVLNATSRLAVNIIQHPGGRPKMVALRNNLVTGATSDEIRYFTDTDFGSSGSAVCDDQWRVVALHRGSQHAQGIQYQGRTEAFVNYGSQIQAVLADIATADAAAAAKITAAQA